MSKRRISASFLQENFVFRKTLIKIMRNKICAQTLSKLFSFKNKKIIYKYLIVFVLIFKTNN